MQNTAFAPTTHVMNELEVCQSAMQFGFVKFIYNKVDGSERVAIGTRNVEFIDQVGGTPKGEDKRAKNPLLYTYYDLTKGEWRCFRTDLFKHLCFGDNGEETMTKESACTQALAMAIADPKVNVERVMDNITTILGTSTASKLVDYVCSHKDEDFEDVDRECRRIVFGIAPKVVVSTHETPSQNAERTSTKVDAHTERLVALCKEEMRLRDQLKEIGARLKEIEQEKRLCLAKL